MDSTNNPTSNSPPRRFPNIFSSQDPLNPPTPPPPTTTRQSSTETHLPQNRQIRSPVQECKTRADSAESAANSETQNLPQTLQPGRESPATTKISSSKAAASSWPVPWSGKNKRPRKTPRTSPPPPLRRPPRPESCRSDPTGCS